MRTTPPTRGSSHEILAPPLFAAIIVIGSIGNTLLIYTVFRWKEMRTPCNYLIVNNAVADLGVVFIAAPLRIVEVYHGWALGEAACRIIAPTQDVFVAVSVLTYTLISWERYRAVITPFKAKLTSTKYTNRCSCYLDNRLFGHWVTHCAAPTFGQNPGKTLLFGVVCIRPLETNVRD